MFTEAEIRFAWMIGCAMFGAGGAFGAVRLGLKGHEKDIRRNEKSIAENRAINIIQEKQLAVFETKIDNIISIITDGRKAREKAQEDHALRFERIGEKLTMIETKLDRLNGDR